MALTPRWPAVNGRNKAAAGDYKDSASYHLLLETLGMMDGGKYTQCENDSQQNRGGILLILLNVLFLVCIYWGQRTIELKMNWNIRNTNEALMVPHLNNSSVMYESKDENSCFILFA